MWNECRGRRRFGSVEGVEGSIVEAQPVNVWFGPDESKAMAYQLFFDRGRMHGVQASWRAHLTNESGAILEGGVFPIHCEEMESHGTVFLTPATLRKAKGVILAPRDLRRRRNTVSVRAAVVRTLSRREGKVEFVLDKGAWDGVWVDAVLTSEGRTVGALSSVASTYCTARAPMDALSKGSVMIETESGRRKSRQRMGEHVRRRF